MGLIIIQSATKMGYYGFDVEPFKELLKYLPTDKNPSAAFVPDKMKVEFDGELTNKVADWTLSNADNMIYINGAIDTWSATAVPESGKTNSLFYFMDGRHHANARIRNMNEMETQKLEATLSEWLDMDIKIDNRKPSIKDLKEMMGSFDSSAQAAKDSAYYNISLEMHPVWENSDGHWLYVEQAVSTMTERPYRQRMYQLVPNSDGSISSVVYTLENESQFIGKWKTPEYFDQFDKSILKEREGCAVILRSNENGFKGSTKGTFCKSSLAGASYATSKVSISENQIESWDQGFNAEGIQVWGAEKGAYIFKRKIDRP